MNTLDRRHFLGAMAAGFAAGTQIACGSPAATPAPAASRTLGPIGVQLYTVRDAMAKDVEGTLERLAGIGFREVEFAGYFEKTPQDIRAMLDRHGLTAPSAHIPYTTLQQGWSQALEAAKVIGHEYVVIPYFDEAQRAGGADTWKRIAADFNVGAAAARAAGLRFAYHNHHFEFVAVDGGPTPMDILLTECDPALVTFELDLFWMQVGQQDPLAYFTRYPGRFPMVHVKDLKKQPERLATDKAEIPFERVFPELADVGQGTIDWARIFARAEQAGIRHYFVEHDQPADAFASVRTSYQYLRALTF